MGVPPALGPLEIAVMEILWERGESNVHHVVGKLDRPLAYTTVMTTLDRLYKKGLLARRKADRAFLYRPRQTRPEWERQRTGEWVAGFLQGPHPSGELLISCLVEAVGQKDAALLDGLEQKSATNAKSWASGGNRDSPLPGARGVPVPGRLYC